MHAFKQVDVFCSTGFSGNPVAVVLDADDLSLQQMQEIARWTNLSETTFVQRPGVDGADYRARIFTPKEELPFAGHPSVGTAHAVIEAGLVSTVSGVLMQECGVGLVRLDIAHGNKGQKVFVTSPEPGFSEIPRDIEPALEQILGISIPRDANPVVIDVGPKWLTLCLPHESMVKELLPDMNLLAKFSEQNGITGFNVFSLVDDSDVSVRVRSFAPAEGVNEDPVCGSGNICVAAHLMQNDRLLLAGRCYTASQGQEIGRNGRVFVRVSEESGAIAVGGYCETRISGEIAI
jgi:PhzF family phenazine biosynthesis protein